MPLNWTNLDLRIGRCGRVRCEPGWSLDERWSASLREYDLWLCWAGRGEMQIDGQKLDLRAGMCLWMRPGHLYLAQQHLPDRLGVTYIHFDLLDESGRRVKEANLPPLAQHIRDPGYFEAAARRITELVHGSTAQREAARQLLRGLLMDLDAPPANSTMTLRHNSQQYQLAMQAATRIREDTARPWTITELADDAGYCPDHFARVFKSVHGQSPREFVVRARVERARELLRETNLSIKQIAKAQGYKSVFFFSRQFTQKSGESPTQWRNRIWGGDTT